jgi:DNA-binding transcriptional ArsR family regulator
MHRFVSFGKCFADPVAIRVMRILLKQESTISDLQEILSLDRHTVDLRLTKLREARIISHRQHGRWLMYSIATDARPVVERLLTNFYHDVTWDQNCVRDDERLRTLNSA